jgi:hypothetical protein
LLLIHLPLGIVMKNLPVLAKVHGLIILFAGAIWILASSRPLTVALVVAYISGSEVLWRISGGSIYWEFGKMAVVCLCLLAIMKSPRLPLPAVLMLCYLLLLLPGLLLSDFGSLAWVSKNISENFSGPASLAIAGVCFSSLRLDYESFQKLLLAFLLPICSLSVVLMFATATAGQINFTGQSNFITSGGFGPVQVSCGLAAACLATYFYSRLPELNPSTRWVTTLLAVLWLGQAALTFSRSGVYIFAGSVLASVPLLLTHKVYRYRLLQAAVAFVVCGSLLLLFLLKFTDGKLQERFTNTNTSGRADMAAAEWQLFRDNPVAGVGMGNAVGARLQARGEAATSHTELTRLLAEHGLLGALALLLLLAVPVAQLVRTRPMLARAFILSSAVYSVLFMAACGMRLVLLSFIYGLTLVRWSQLSPSPKPARIPAPIRSCAGGLKPLAQPGS